MQQLWRIKKKKNVLYNRNGWIETLPTNFLQIFFLFWHKFSKDLSIFNSWKVCIEFFSIEYAFLLRVYLWSGANFFSLFFTMWILYTMLIWTGESSRISRIFYWQKPQKIILYTNNAFTFIFVVRYYRRKTLKKKRVLYSDSITHNHAFLH